MHLEPISRKQLDLLFRNNRSLITRVCCEAIRSAILVTAWLLVVCVSIYVYLSTWVTPGLRPIGTPCPFSLQCPYNSTIIVREEKTAFKQQWRSNEVTNLLPHGLSQFHVRCVHGGNLQSNMWSKYYSHRSMFSRAATESLTWHSFVEHCVWPFVIVMLKSFYCKCDTMKDGNWVTCKLRACFTNVDQISVQLNQVQRWS